LDLFSHCQGTSASDDRTGVKLLRPEVHNAETGKNDAFWIEAEETGKCIKDLATETQEESAAAVARGKGMAVETGCPGWPRVPNIYYCIQVPLAQDNAMVYRSAALAPSDPGPISGSEEDPQPAFRSLGANGDDNDSGAFRSLSAEESPPKRLKTADATGVRLSRGSYAGDAVGVITKNIKRAKGEPITISTSIVVAIPGDSAPSEESIKDLVAFSDKLKNIAGESKRLFDKDAGLTTGAPLDGQAAEKILQKMTPKAPLVGMVVG